MNGNATAIFSIRRQNPIFPHMQALNTRKLSAPQLNTAPFTRTVWVLPLTPVGGVSRAHTESHRTLFFFWARSPFRAVYDAVVVGAHHLAVFGVGRGTGPFSRTSCL